MREDYLLLIDGSGLLSTQFYGNLPREILYAKTVQEKEKYFHKIMMTSTGVYTNAVFGFMRTLLSILKKQKPTYLAVTWDLSRNTFRRELYPEYKANRAEVLEPLRSQFILCEDVLRRMGIVQFMDERYEADDFCGSLAKKFEGTLPVRILTKDQDYLQLVTERTNLWMLYGAADKSEALFRKYKLDKQEEGVPDRVFPLNPERVEEEYGVPPRAIPSLKGLKGDASDNIKGVSGIGEKTAVKLIQEYGTVEKLYQAIENLDAEQEARQKQDWKERLGLKRSPLPYLLKTSDTELVGRQAAFLSEKLATIQCDIDLSDVTLDSLRTKIQLDETRKIFNELEFHTLQSELEDGLGEEKEAIAANYQWIEDYLEAEQTVRRISGQEKIAIQFISDRETLYALTIATQEKQVVCIPVQFFITEEILVDWARGLCQTCQKVYVFDLKSMLRWLGEEEYSSLCDVNLAAYLMNPLHSGYTWTGVAQENLNCHVESEKSFWGKDSVAQKWETQTEQVKDYVCLQTDCAWQAGSKLEKQLEECAMAELFRTIEMPLVYCLYRMERTGVRVNASVLEECGTYLQELIEQREQEIYDLTEETFNINSPKQLGEVLFGKLHMPNGKKTKTGYSTSADVLEKLAKDYPVVKKILDYRQLTKLKSTNISSVCLWADVTADHISIAMRKCCPSIVQISQSVTACRMYFPVQWEIRCTWHASRKNLI